MLNLEKLRTNYGGFNCSPMLVQNNGRISMYLVDDEVLVDELIKEVTYSKEFIEVECEAKCSCGLC